MRILLFSLLFIFSFPTFSQEKPATESEPKTVFNEVRLDGIKLIAGPILEGSYEFVRNKNSGLGVSVLVNLDTDNDYPENFSITPFYRAYFWNKRDYGASGFFVEGFGKLSTGDNGTSFIEDADDGVNFTDFSIGMSLGKKWVNNSGFVFQLLVGVGRPLGSDPGNEAYFRGGLFVGYRF